MFLTTSMDVIKKKEKFPFMEVMPSVGSSGNLYKKGFSDYTQKIPSAKANDITVFFIMQLHCTSSPPPSACTCQDVNTSLSTCHVQLWSPSLTVFIEKKSFVLI